MKSCCRFYNFGMGAAFFKFIDILLYFYCPYKRQLPYIIKLPFLEFSMEN